MNRNSLSACLWMLSFCYVGHFCKCDSNPDAGLYMIPYPPRKTQYLIGGWDPGDTVQDFMKRYQPIFQDYLTEQIGPLYNPPISFKLIPTDWPQLGNQTTTASVMIEQGQLDFTCKRMVRFL